MGLDCQPSRLLVKRVYGVELTTLVKMDRTKVPVVISSCIEEVEKRGRSNSIPVPIVQHSSLPLTSLPLTSRPVNGGTVQSTRNEE